MLKSSFSKYITAFVLIIFLSFVMLSAIITSIIRTHAEDETKAELLKTVTFVAKYVETLEKEDITKIVDDSSLLRLISALENNLNIMLAGPDGKVLVETAFDDETGTSNIIYGTDLGKITPEGFTLLEGSDDIYVQIGTLGGRFTDNMIIYSKPVGTHGYVVAYAPRNVYHSLVNMTRNSIINSSIWVMLAAVIAIYFVTERIIRPLKNMTVAVKKFGKGDFSTRVTVYGKDEVAELGNAFNSMADSLESLEKMRNSFLANISHDLRTPMTTISGFIDGITSGAIPPEKHEYYLNIISAEVHRLSRLVSQILDVSRLESGDRKFNKEDFDITEVARLILISFESKIDSKRLDVVFDVEDEELFAFADKDAIYQVLYNLCHNAIKFSKEGGEFRISIKRAPQRKLLISVFDEGQTLSDEESKLIFERFYKTDTSRGLDKSGVGLGLYISKTIIDAHEEDIFVSSEGGRGCRISFTIKEGSPVVKRKRADSI